MEDTQQEDEIWKGKALSEGGVGGAEGRGWPGGWRSVTLCNEDGVLQVCQQGVLVVTLVPEEDQEPGDRKDTPEVRLTRPPQQAGLASTQEPRFVRRT